MELVDETGFNAFWDGAVDTFRNLVIDEPMEPGGNLEPVNNHVTGPIDANGLANQNAYPFIMSVPMNWSPNYATNTTDQGVLEMQVVAFAADIDIDVAFEKARVLGGRIVDNVEDNRALVDDEGRANASAVWLDDFQMDFTPSGAQSNQQIKYCNLVFRIEAKRSY